MFATNILIYFSLIATVFADFRVTLPDTSNLDRPCDLDDYACISRVNPVKRWCEKPITDQQPLRQPFLIPHMTIEAAYFNVTHKKKDISVIGLDNGEVTEFYLNWNTNKAVLGIRFSDFVIRTMVTMVLFRPKQEPVTVTAHAYEHYPEMTVTTILDSICSRRPSISSSVYLPHVPHFYLGEGIDEIKNDDARYMVQQLFKEPTVTITELFSDRSHILADFYVNNAICDA